MKWNLIVWMKWMRIVWMKWMIWLLNEVKYISMNEMNNINKSNERSEWAPCFLRSKKRIRIIVFMNIKISKIKIKWIEELIDMIWVRKNWVIDKYYILYVFG